MQKLSTTASAAVARVFDVRVVTSPDEEQELRAELGDDPLGFSLRVMAARALPTSGRVVVGI